MDKLIVWLNRVFRRPRVGGRESSEAYSQWEYETGQEFARVYLEPAGDLDGKSVLDVGCGLGGKTVAFGESGARAVIGIDILAANVSASHAYAREHPGAVPSLFLAADAASLPFANATFDTVVASDAMEHFSHPGSALAEMHRVVTKGGAIWIFFTPHFSPLGSHLYDYIYTPWCHLLFTRAQIARAVRRVLEVRAGGDRANGAAIDSRVREIMRSYDEDLNHMSVRRFLKMVRETPALTVRYLELRPAKFRFLKPFTLLPLVRELVTGFVVCRLQRMD